MWVRILGVLLALTATFIAFVAMSINTTASQPGGWLPAASGFLPGLLLGAFLIGIGRWYTAIAVSVAGALLLGGWMHHTAPPEFSRLYPVADRLGAPQEWTLRSQQEVGSTWCVSDGCPQLHLNYSTQESVSDARKAIVALLESDGWKRSEVADSDRYGVGNIANPDDYQAWHRGRWDIRFSIEATDDRGFDAPSPDEQTQIRVLLSG
ncbi:MAG: hypothetical protein QM655_12125 [Nocardioidaceae bacterium]